MTFFAMDTSSLGLISTTVFLSLVLATSFVAYWYLTIPRNIPPGPFCLPVVGYLPFLGKLPYLTFMKLGKKYGPIFSLYLGSRLVIVLNDYQSIKEAFVNQANNFAGRPIGLNLNFFRSQKETKSISMTDGKFWQEHRQFITHFLRDCGMGKVSLEPQLMEEVQHFVAEVKSYQGAPTDLTDLIALSVCNNIATLLLGRRFDYNDPWFVSMMCVNDSVVSRNTVSAGIAFPWVQKIPGIGYLNNQSRMMVKALIMIQSMVQRIKENNKTKTSGYTASYINAFFDEKLRRMDQTNRDSDTFNDDSLIQNIRTLMSAGTETTANTIMWAIIFLMLYPDIQRRAQAEVDAVIGADRNPVWSDHTRTPYVEATIYEIQRSNTLVPLNVPHRNMTETTLMGYRIPQSTYIVSNLYAVHNDPTIWKSPEVFNPERFLDSNGIVKRPKELVVFSLGKRQCLGEPLARVELYLYITTLLQHFTFEAPGGIPPSQEVKLGLTLRPKQFLTRAMPRRKS